VNSSERGQAGDPDLADPGSPEEPSRSLISRWLSKADRYASHPLTAVLVIGAAVIWIAISVAAGFPSQWEIVFQSVVAAVTLAVLFIIQHTQARYQRATQRKLDEILLTMSGTDNSLLALEHAPTRNSGPPATGTARFALWLEEIVDLASRLQVAAAAQAAHSDAEFVPLVQSRATSVALPGSSSL